VEIQVEREAGRDRDPRAEEIRRARRKLHFRYQIIRDSPLFFGKIGNCPYFFQSQEYQEMSSHEKSPALENAASGGGAIAFSSISADGDMTVERRARVILNGDPVPPPGFEKLPLLEKLFEVPAPEGGATPAAK